jgi:hypothetical protein
MKRYFILFLALTALVLPVSVNAQVFAQARFFRPAGEKKVGEYIWVWRAEKIRSGGQKVIEADCPHGYAVLGNGYQVDPPDLIYTGYSKPNGGFDGWTVSAGNSSSNPPVTVTVYASCAPPQ